MRLATVDTDWGPAAALVRDDGVVRIDGFADVGALLRDGSAGLGAARAAADGASEPLEEARLLRPVLQPGAVVCVGLNYRNHILEMGRDLPADPPEGRFLQPGDEVEVSIDGIATIRNTFVAPSR